jgi:pyrroloquinoline quinone (PQQ) biosynthesis protein C
MSEFNHLPSEAKRKLLDRLTDREQGILSPVEIWERLASILSSAVERAERAGHVPAGTVAKFQESCATFRKQLRDNPAAEAVASLEALRLGEMFKQEIRRRQSATKQIGAQPC